MDVFAYGTLTDPDRAGELLAEYDFRGEAVLEGLHRVEGAYPTLAPGGRTAGRLLRTPEIDRLDRYEGVERGLYTRIAVPLIDGPAEISETKGTSGTSETSREERSGVVAVYVGDPAALDAPAEWPGEGAFAARAERYVREQGVVVNRGRA